jgi:hypothetical protein
VRIGADEAVDLMTGRHPLELRAAIVVSRGMMVRQPGRSRV